MFGLRHCFIFAIFASVAGGSAAQGPKPYRLPDLGEQFKDRVIWGSEAQSPDGFLLAFGGQDQVSDDGIGHTRVKKTGGEWAAIQDDLARKYGVLHKHWKSRVEEQRRLAEHQANLRRAYFQGESGEATRQLTGDAAEQISFTVVGLAIAAEDAKLVADDSRLAPAAKALRLRTNRLTTLAKALAEKLKRNNIDNETLQDFDALLVELGKTADLLAAEPPPRALSPLIYEPQSGQFYLFGGDHLDYLTNDVWAFDPKEKQWSIRLPVKAPRPRANHSLKASGNGKIVMTGGYRYTSNTDYLGGQYIDLDDGEWVYDVEKNTWTGEGPMVAVDERTYRTGPFHPEFYYQPKPDRDAHEKALAALPSNQWVKMNPPKLPRLNRDWGTAILDPQHDLMLRFSGGHSAHGGTDVLHYHIATNRWELCYPVEFPLGQLYSNTSYPNGFNFNGRPWITGHTYQNYGWEPRLKKMLFTGRPNYTYVYDVDRGDWTGRFEKPAGMTYNSCFYTLTLCPTPRGLVCWTKDGELFRYSVDEQTWLPLETGGEKLPGAVVDNSTVTYDSKRNHLLFFVKGYGQDRRYDGQIYAVDLKTMQVSQLSPAGMEAAAAVSYLCQIRYDEANDLLLVGATLPPDSSGLRRTPAYDSAANRWVSLKITGDDPSGDKGRNVSLGMMYDARRKTFWAVDTNSQVYGLKLDIETADMQPLK